MGNVINLYKQEPQEQGTGLPKVIQYVDPSSLVEHEESQRIPEMTAEEWVDFFESVRSRNQVIEPLSVLPDGRVYDGRHRLKAAKELGLRFVPVIFYDISEDEALQRMADSAVLRRSLLPGQRAAIVLEFSELVEELRREAKERQRQAGGDRGNQYTGGKVAVTPNLEEAPNKKGETAEVIAEKAGIGKSSIYMLQAVQRDAPDLFEKVKDGKITINKAYTAKKDREQGGEEPKITEKSNKKRISETLKKVEKLTLPADETKDTLDPINLVRDQVNRSIPQFARQYIYVYEILPHVDKETLNGYTKQLQSVAEGSLLILAEYESNEKRRVLYELMTMIIQASKDDKKLDDFIKSMGGLLNEEK